MIGTLHILIDCDCENIATDCRDMSEWVYGMTDDDRWFMQKPYEMETWWKDDEMVISMFWGSYNGYSRISRN